MLHAVNGLFAFESALHVRHISGNFTPSLASLGLMEWNADDLWRNWYGARVDGLLFFAEDIFGCQFALKEPDGVFSFDPESAEIEFVAGTLEGWVQEILKGYPMLTGFPLAHSWQSINGRIPIGKRLLPKVPFVLGGEYSPENLVAVGEVEAMRYRGDLWRQLCHLPDGAKVQLKPLPVH